MRRRNRISLVAAGALLVGVSVAVFAPGVSPELVRNEQSRDEQDPLARSAKPTPAIELSGLEMLPGAALGSVLGHDPAAPRELTLWVGRDDRWTRVSDGESDARGALHFPPVATPEPEFAYRVTTLEASPTAPGASASLAVSRPGPQAPRAVVRKRSGNEVLLRVYPSEARGHVLVGDAAGNVFGEQRIPNHPAAPGRVFDMVVTLAPDDRAVWVAQRASDGRRSRWRGIELAPIGTGVRP